MTLPTFIVIGARKAASTALYHCLRQHPQIFMTNSKEPNFFALDGERLDFVEPDGSPAVINKSRYVDIESYSRLFQPVFDQRAIGEASVMYLSCPRAAERIHHYVPGVQLIAQLRNPIESAYSEFRMNRGFGIEPCDNLIDAVRDQERRKIINCVNCLYIDNYLHFKNLKNFMDYFSKEQFRIYLYDDFKNNRDALIKDVFDFLHVDSGFTPELPVPLNISGIPKSMLLHRFLTKRTNPLARRIARILPTRGRFILLKIKQWNLRRKAMPQEIRAALMPYFKEDILLLQDFLDRDLSEWLQ